MKELRVTLDFNPEGEIQKSLNEQMYYLHPGVHEVVFVGNEVVLSLDDSAPTDSIKTFALEVVKSTLQSFRKVENRVIYESEHPVVESLALDPHAQLAESGDLLPGGVGTFGYQGLLLKTLRALDRTFLEMALQMKAIEHDYPTTLPLASMLECGYVASFPQHAMFVANAHRDFEGIRAMSAYKSVEAGSSLGKHLDTPHAILAPTVCYHCFQAFKNRTLPHVDVMFTALAKCHRHEFKTVIGLERLNTFSMRELIFFGSKNFVNEQKQRIQQKTIDVLNSWGLKFRILGANDPFFATTAANKRTYQSLFDLKQEIQVLLPYKNKWLAIGSVNNHQAGLVNSFGIKSQSEGAELHSGCVGIGYERLALGLFSQKGLDPAKWSPELRKAFEN